MDDATKIVKANCWKQNLELTRSYSISYRTISHVENIFVQLETGNGNSGIGSGSPAEFVTGETSKSAIDILDKKLEQLLLGKDIRYLKEHCRTLETEMPNNPAAATAIDIALHEILAKHLHIPLVDLLGRVHHKLPSSITIGIKETVEETLNEAAEHLEKGFRIIKLKIGKNVERDIETTRKLHEKVGKSMKIRVDANQGYSARDLIRYVKETESCKLELIEQPVRKNSEREMFDVPAEIRKICAGDESIRRPKDAQRYSAHPQPFGIYNIKLMKCGGVYLATCIADIAQLAGIELMWGCMDESAISITAALHAALASPATRYLDLDGSLDLAQDVVKGGFIVENGYMSVTDKPGLGVQLIT
ncbi:MAG: chloromuconate cycloisomerase [Gammaproteobacteria bacterium SG8_11]|nr:MAG: chloromuconate cycloisomerase [Gammaproteobacteria bacterium SG8_11]